MKRVFAHIGFSIALTLVVLNLIDITYIPIILAGLVVILATSLVLNKYRKALTVPICLMSAIFSCVVFLGVYNADAKPQLSLNDTEANASFYIIDLVEYDNEQYIYTVKTTQVVCDNAPQNIKLRVKTDERLNADYYQVINGTLKFNKISDSAFDSYGYWADDIFLSCKLSDSTVTDDHICSVNKYVLQLRQSIINRLYSLMPNDNGALAIALLIGDMSLLSEDAYNDFKLAGSTHIMAVSGMHLVIITTGLAFILKKLRLPMPARIITMFVSIVFYVALAGFAKSIIRAALMTTVLLIGELFKRRADALNSLGVAITIMCFNPFAVCDVGAVLSVMAVLALVTITKSVNNKLLKIETLNKPIIKTIIDSIVITLSVMLYTIPVMYINFGYFSIAGVVTNVLLVPVGTVGMVLSFFTYITSFIGALYTPFVWLTTVATQIMLDVADFFASSRYAVVNFSDNFYIVIAAGLLILAIAFISHKKRNVRIAVFTVVTMLIISLLFSNLLTNNNQNSVYICENSAVVVNAYNKTLVVGLNNGGDYYSVSNYLFKNGLSADVIVLTNNNKSTYSVELAQNYDCTTFIMPTGNETVLYDLPNIDVYQTDVQDFTLNDNYYFNVRGKEVTVYVDDFILSINNNNYDCDIKIVDSIVTDSNGDIDLSQGNIVYYLGEEKTYSVRRVD